MRWFPIIFVYNEKCLVCWRRLSVSIGSAILRRAHSTIASLESIQITTYRYSYRGPMCFHRLCLLHGLLKFATTIADPNNRTYSVIFIPYFKITRLGSNFNILMLLKLGKEGAVHREAAKQWRLRLALKSEIFTHSVMCQQPHYWLIYIMWTEELTIGR